MTFQLDRIKVVAGLCPTDMTSTTPASTTYIDRRGYNSALVCISNSAGTSGTLTQTFFDGATTSPTTAVTLDSTPAVLTIDEAGYNVYQIDLRGFNRYFKVTMTPALSSNHSYVSCDVILMDAEVNPASAYSSTTGYGTAATILKKA